MTEQSSHFSRIPRKTLHSQERYKQSGNITDQLLRLAKFIFLQ